MTIKRLDVPRSFGGDYVNQPTPHSFILWPVFGRDGWYQDLDTECNPIEWIEYQGKVYEPVGSLLEELERLTIAERPLRDCEFELLRKLEIFRIDPNRDKILNQEKARRSDRLSRVHTRLRTLQIRKEQRSGTQEGLDRAVDVWIENLGRLFC